MPSTDLVLARDNSCRATLSYAKMQLSSVDNSHRIWLCLVYKAHYVVTEKKGLRGDFWARRLRF